MSFCKFLNIYVNNRFSGYTNDESYPYRIMKNNSYFGIDDRYIIIVDL